MMEFQLSAVICSKAATRPALEASHLLAIFIFFQSSFSVFYSKQTLMICIEGVLAGNLFELIKYFRVPLFRIRSNHHHLNKLPRLLIHVAN